MRIVLTTAIVSYNTQALTLDCLRSLSDEIRYADLDVLLIDNASADGSTAAISDGFPQVRLIALERNIGFAAANNLAARQARGQWLLLLNPDTVVLDGAIDKLIAFAEVHPEASIFGGRTLFADGSLNPTSCWAAPTLWSMFCSASGLARVFGRNRVFNPEAIPGWHRNTVREVDIVTGCFLLIRRSLWDELGGFDEGFFMYGEDADLCLRARQLGHRCLICPDATIIHYGGASEKVRSGKMVRLFTAKAQLFRRHWPAASARLGVAMLDLWALARLAAFGAASLLSPSKYREQTRTWREIWSRRRTWHKKTSVPAETPFAIRPVTEVTTSQCSQL